MSDIRHSRASSKRKSRDASDEPTTRKKQHRQAEVESDEDVQFEDPSSEEELDVDSTRSKKASGTRKEKEYPSVNELKKRIRDVKRLLAKGTLPADARVLQERALAGYEQDLAEETARRQRSHMIKKYHFVRFLEKDRLQRKIHEARVNLNYTIYCPLPEKYISLYPKRDAKTDTKTDGDASDPKPESEGPKPPLWSVVEKCMEEGTLDDLREGRMNISADGKPIPVREKPLPVANKQKSKKEDADGKKSRKDLHAHKNAPAKRDKQARKDYGRERDRLQDVAVEPAEDDSDGGFFEE
ncbi:hypothetical protein N7468_005205 [Penicillium chermesinum]|uniref:rRNA-processing protein EFG1 n=1 Tax=Penicillium chermesinum TaxID=63820 RepID=A0A9W9NYQ2_9EURO|nr:uncharacterized protein N7468_005205 [Penicillium chermesinum]KAJ5232249.1 hypothetical protein N7468_005205 [Penicillium chermesinum]